MFLGLMWHWWLLIIFAGFVWINLGYAFGEFNLRVYHDKYTQKWLRSDWLKKILWPYSSGLDSGGYFTSLIIEKFFENKHEIGYKIIMSVVWPFKPVINLAFSIFFLSVYASLFFIDEQLPGIVKSIFKFITFPIRKLGHINGDASPA